MEPYPFSVHAFMLPLKWDYLPETYTATAGKQSFDYDTRTSMEKVNEKLKGSLFHRRFYRLDNNILNYNELSYFHAYVVKSLFDLQQSDEPTTEQVSKNKTVLYYEVNTDEYSRFILETARKTFTLKLSGISLHVFNTGIAIITYNIENFIYTESEDILLINETGRRFYPPFLSGNEGSLTDAAKSGILARKIALELPGQYIMEDFCEYDSLAKKETHQFLNGEYCFGQIITIPGHVVKLFNQDFVIGAKQEVADKIRLNIIGDDRMFYQCWYGNKQMAEKLSTTESGVPVLTDPFWFAFTNGDRSVNSLGLKSEEFLKEYNKSRTYRLWEGYGSFFGFTRDSFVCLSVDLKTNAVPDLRNQMKTLYYQMSVLCLLQRASVLRFSAEVSSLADLGKEDPGKASGLIEKLYLNYIEFINKIYFREVTPQMQGIEMYQRMQDSMNIKDDINNLDDELGELNSFSMSVKEDARNREAVKLSRLATWFLPASLMFGILGANYFGSNWDLGNINGVWKNVFWTATGFAPGILLYLLVKYKIIKI